MAEARDMALPDLRAETVPGRVTAPVQAAGASLHHIVIVGGGAGGLVLATKLGRRLGRNKQVLITLIDASLTHVWKPLLHEVAVGTLDSHKDDVLFLSHAKNHGFRFQQGRMDGLDRARKLVHLAPIVDADGLEVIARRTMAYDTLVIATGGICNDFGTPGVKAHDWLRELDGLETNRANQLVVDTAMRTTRDPDVFAIGDCAACQLPGQDQPLPPRAQVAYQQAMALAQNLRRRLAGQPLEPFRYKDYGSLVSLSYSSVGTLMGNLLGDVMIEGRLARLTYQSLYKKHQLAVHGPVWVALVSLINILRRGTEPRLKLHL